MGVWEMWKRRCSKGVYMRVCVCGGEGGVCVCVCVCVRSFCPVWDSQLACFVPHTLHVQVLKVLLRSYQELETPDYISVCQVHALPVS